jgi:hypothetical protein
MVGNFGFWRPLKSRYPVGKNEKQRNGCIQSVIPIGSDLERISPKRRREGASTGRQPELTLHANPLMMNGLAHSSPALAVAAPTRPQAFSIVSLVAPSFNGRTADSGSAYRGSNPWGAATVELSAYPTYARTDHSLYDLPLPAELRPQHLSRSSGQQRSSLPDEEHTRDRRASQMKMR